MTLGTFIWRGLRFHARSHLGTLLGAAVGSAVLIGALVVGDSVRESLREMASFRLGQADFALAGGDRFFRDSLAPEMAGTRTGGTSGLLQIFGTASAVDGAARASKVQILGVDDAFWRLAPRDPALKLNVDEVAINAALASHLGARVGATVILRAAKPSLLSRELPVSSQKDSSVALRLKVARVLADDEFGAFSLQANQTAPFNAFVSRSVLQTRLDQTNRANLLLVGEGRGNRPDALLKKSWSLADAELSVPQTTPGSFEIRSRRVFLDPPAAMAADQCFGNATHALTYFVNEIRAGDRTTPYSMVTAADAPLVPTEMRDDEILLSPWLAGDLQARSGDLISLRYFVLGETRRLEERTNQFRVRVVLPPGLPHADRTLMPGFPGLATAESSHDWDTGFPIDLNKIRPADEKYWKEFRGTPKAFITLAAGKKMWANRFGDLTAIRFSDAAPAAEVETRLLRALDPPQLGLVFQAVGEQAERAYSEPESFAGLFIGFSFFLIVAALLLMALLFQFGVEQRSQEVGTLLALGFRPGLVRRLLLLEGAAVALVGGALGVVGGLLYARALVLGLTTIWRSAVAGSALRFHATTPTLLIGLFSSVVVSSITLWISLRGQARRPARELLSDENSERPVVGKIPRRPWAKWIAISSGILAGATVAWAFVSGENQSAELFFCAAALGLVAGLAGSAVFLRSMVSSRFADAATVASLGIRNASRRRKRSLATIGLLACGSFLVIAVAANKLESARDAGVKTSGTGGFALIAETTMPVVSDLRDPAGRENFGLDGATFDSVNFVPLRMKDGDDASCLNLNRAQSPRLLGVRPDLMEGRFTLAKTVDSVPVKSGWQSLRADPAAEAIPAIADAASIQWALGKKLGDTIDYTDEQGKKFKVRLVGALANSILQGSLLIDEAAFVRRFPGSGGHRMYLIDVPSNRGPAVASALSRSGQDWGMEVTRAGDRLDQFNAVQNTYLSTFQVLGGLGLLLGSAGLGVVVLRNVLERRPELALLQAVGFRPRTLRHLVFAEHGALLLAGLGVGTLAGLVAVLPALLAPGGGIPYLSLALILGAVLGSGLLWALLATRWALRGNLLSALRLG